MNLFKILLFVFLVTASRCGFAQSGSREPKVFAMVIGISKYVDANIPTLKYADKDAALFHQFLKSPGAGAIPDQNLVLLTNEKATRANILREITQLLSRSSNEDLVLFYFSGHGKNDVFENSGFLLTYDTENDNEAATALSMSEIGNKLDRCKSKMTISYLDACHAGLFRTKGTKGTGNDNAEIVKAYTAALADAGSGNIAFLASSARQQSLEDDKLQQGVFTHFLIAGLKGEADKAQKETSGFDNGIVTAGELQTYLVSKIEEATRYKQKPVVTGLYDEDFPLSILRPGLQLSKEISKRLVKPQVPLITAPVVVSAADFKVPADELLSNGMSLAGRLCHGQYAFINLTTSDLLLYAIRTRNAGANGYGGKYDVSNKIAPSGKSLTPRLYVYQAPWADNINQCNDLYDDYDFYFSKKDASGKTQYAQVTATVESRKKRYLVLSDDNVNFTFNMPVIK